MERAHGARLERFEQLVVGHGECVRRAGPERYNRRVRSLALLVLLAACGSTTAPERRIGDTVAIGWRAIADAERSLEPHEGDAAYDGAREAVVGARERLSRLEGTVRIWQEEGVGELAWYTLAPCFATALDRVESELTEVSLPVPADLDQARQMALESSSRDCAERTPSPR
jgi:hypothetical protein